MLSIGGQLYNLTDRDRQTLLLEPLVRRETLTWSIGVASLTWSYNIPPDRCLVLQNVSLGLNAGAAAARINQLAVSWKERDSEPLFCFIHQRQNANLAGDGQLAAAERQNVNLHNLDLLLPPGGVLYCSATRSDTTVAGFLAPTVFGYLIPPGGIGRSA